MFLKCRKDALRWFAIAFVSLVPASACAQTIKVMSSGGFAPAYKQLAPQFEKATGAHMETVWGPSMGTTSDAIPVRLTRGERRMARHRNLSSRAGPSEAGRLHDGP